MYSARAYDVSIPLYEESVEDQAPKTARALCIELVGNRFLRRMVRLLVATAVREAQKSEDERDEGILKAICFSGDRTMRAYPFPGIGLAFAGCGFDYRSLAYYKFISKTKRAMLDEEFKRETLRQVASSGFNLYTLHNANTICSTTTSFLSRV